MPFAISAWRSAFMISARRAGEVLSFTPPQSSFATSFARAMRTPSLIFERSFIVAQEEEPREKER